MDTGDVPPALSDLPMPETLGLVLPHTRVLYVVTPKAGCTTLLWTLAHVQGEQLSEKTRFLTSDVTRSGAVHDYRLWVRTLTLQHLSAAERAAIGSDESWLRFCLVRHPVTRLWSAWQSKVLLREPYYTTHFASRSWFPRIPTTGQDVADDFRAFVEALDSDPTLLRADPHWNLQTGLIRADTFPYTHIGRVEDLAATLDLLEDHLHHNGWSGDLPRLQENKSLLPITFAQLTPGMVETIEALYDVDMRVLDYRSLAGDERVTGVSGAPAGSQSDVDLVIGAVGEIAARHQRIGDLWEVACEFQNRLNSEAHEAGPHV